MTIDIAALLSEAQRIQQQDKRTSVSVEVFFHGDFVDFTFSVAEKGNHDDQYRARNRESRMAWELENLKTTADLIIQLRSMFETVKARIEK